MTDYSIGEVADILNITTRTLRHWDQIGLLVPSWRTWADHRLYTDADMERALQILVYREAGLQLGRSASSSTPRAPPPRSCGASGVCSSRRSVNCTGWSGRSMSS